MYFVNGYNFHTEHWNAGKKTYNCGVCLKGAMDIEDENDYYGIIKEIVELEYIGEPTKRLMLFNCEWFDNVVNRGVKVHNEYGIVEVRCNRRYVSYDPFIFAINAIQVYYVPYPDNVRDKRDWWVVIKTKPRHSVDDRYTLEVAYQEASSLVNYITRDETLGTLRDEEGNHDEVQSTLGHDEEEEEEEEEEDEDIFDTDDDELEEDEQLEIDDDDDNDNNDDDDY